MMKSKNTHIDYCFRSSFKIIYISIGIFLCMACNAEIENRQVILLDSNWKFYNGEVENGEKRNLPATDWETVVVPHDWAISGEFDPKIDEQVVMVIEDGDKVPKLRTGRTGGLPHVGVGWYRKELELPLSHKGKSIYIEFDGVMSNAKVYINGKFVGEWPYGYASFGFDLTEFVKFGKQNILAVRVENKPNSARWYPGAGLYRNVRLVITNPIRVKQWGTYVTTPEIAQGRGTVNIKTTILNSSKELKNIKVNTDIVSSFNEVVASISSNSEINASTIVEQNVDVLDPEFWSIESPTLYKAVTSILEKGQVIDRYETTFGFRFIEFTNNNGFFLNGERVQLKGVCLHHDLGPLGAAVNTSALRYRMKLLQDMGCNAIRTAHNPPTPGLLDLADEMGILIVNEAFDEWKIPKNENGYSGYWDEWAEKDLVAFIHRDRNHPSVILWSIGNEVREQKDPEGGNYARFLTDICHREDPSRLTTAGFNDWNKAIENGLTDGVDVPGWNYKPHLYNKIHKEYPHWKMYGSETASTVSSRGEYYFPAKQRVHYLRETYHSSSFDNEFPNWGTSPDKEMAAQDDCKFMAGEFVWIGFDYLGEPTPYNLEWPSRSSYFGIIDLCGIPKDRYFLYQSNWTDNKVLHLLPHWNWEQGQEVSVHCYTNYDRAELFLNGKSLGIREKDPSKQYTRYRLIWDDITYEPGEIKVVALDSLNNMLAEEVKKTAGAPAKIHLKADRTVLSANDKEMVFVTVSIIDENGIVCPRANNLVNFTVNGAGVFKAVGNGDPTSLESFVKPFRKAFNGKCMLIAKSTYDSGQMVIEASSVGLESQQLIIETK